MGLGAAMADHGEAPLRQPRAYARRGEGRGRQRGGRALDDHGRAGRALLELANLVAVRALVEVLVRVVLPGLLLGQVRVVGAVNDAGAARLALGDVGPVGVLPPLGLGGLPHPLPQLPLLVLPEEAAVRGLVSPVAVVATLHAQLSAVGACGACGALLHQGVARRELRPQGGAGAERWHRSALHRLLPPSAPFEAVLVQALHDRAGWGHETGVRSSATLGLEGARLSLLRLLHEKTQLVINLAPDAVVLARLVQAVKDLLRLFLGHPHGLVHARQLLLQ
mmetsp:Transcript_12679/g.37648  ORF Transcript_12679/g.37648 Transcript_12679/m.37648 type:complete len:279 (+) Transcript_12679:1252-2088(+)